MAPRVDSKLLLVGSLPAGSADSALRAAAGFFGDLVFALPDGETGPRSAWVGYERERLVRPNPGVVVVQETESPTGIQRHAYETPVLCTAGSAVSPARTAPRPCGSTRAWSARRAARNAREGLARPRRRPSR